jgi:3-oxoacyl-[acyl-carrier-protein] synthase-1
MTAYINDYNVVCALGADVGEVRSALFREDAPSGVGPSTFFSAEKPLPLGHVRAALPSLAHAPLAFQSRNNALLAKAMGPLNLDQVVSRAGGDRVGIILGTSTSGVGESERAHDTYARTGHVPADWHFGQHELSSGTGFLAWSFNVTGPTLVVSTACSSSAKAIASAARWLRDDVVDVVICGGADSMCRFTVAGFLALESVSAERSNPLSQNRKGINIGEGVALFVMSRRPGPVRLAGWGESSDAYHLSAPDPKGRGAIEAMQQSLSLAQLTARDVDYLNLHGTGTRQNDAMESHAVSAVLGHEVPVSSTKPLTGHTLGASGAIEAALCLMALTGSGALPPHWYDGAFDPALPALSLATPGTTSRRAGAPRVVMSNSFAFGGNNAALVMVRE